MDRSLMLMENFSPGGGGGGGGGLSAPALGLYTCI